MKTKLQRIVYPMFVFVAVVVNAILLTVLIVAVTEHPYDPFGDFPLQTAEDTMVVGSTITVEGTKCYTEPVTVRGTVVWRMVSPVSSQFQTFEGTARRPEAGCVTETFENRMPDDVATFVRSKLLENEPVFMQIEGAETPVEGGVTKRWVTTVFEVTW